MSEKHNKVAMSRLQLLEDDQFSRDQKWERGRGTGSAGREGQWSSPRTWHLSRDFTEEQLARNWGEDCRPGGAAAKTQRQKFA